MTDTNAKTSINLTPENRAFLDEHIGNNTEFINELLTAYRNGQSTIDAAIARFRIEQIQSELQSIEQRRESLKDELSRHRQAEDAATTAYEDKINTLVSKLEDNIRLWPDHRLIREIAAEHNSRPEQVLTDVIEAAESEDIQTETVDR